jgi:presenilin-like A22 family membrane protease
MQFKLKIFSKTAFLFALTQVLGIFVATKVMPEVIALNAGDAASFSLGSLIYLAVLIFIFFFVGIKFPRAGAVIYRIFLTLVIFAAFQTFTSIWFISWVPLVIGVAAVAIFWIRPSVVIQDLVMMISLATIGSIFGLSLTPMVIVYILIIFSIYDLISVYVTGHMVKMAEVMIKSRAIFGFVVPSSVEGFKTGMRHVQPGEQFMILGSGDVIFPLIMIASLIRISMAQAWFVLVFSVIGLFVMHLIFVNQKIRQPMPALPPIAALTIIGYFIAKLLNL